MKKYLKKLLNINLIAYCIMDNHAHILIYVEDIKQMEKFMRMLNTAYAIAYNLAEEREGYVFVNRYHSQIIESGNHLIACIKYILENPVKAGIVNLPEEYKYSSYNPIFNGETNFILEKNWLYKEVKEEYKFIDESIEKSINNKEDIEEMINEFCVNHDTSISKIKNSNTLIIELKRHLNSKYRVSNKNISAILGIGKNRITEIEKSEAQIK